MKLSECKLKKVSLLVWMSKKLLTILIQPLERDFESNEQNWYLYTTFLQRFSNFEIVGFNSQFVEKYFPYTASRIEGIGLYEIEKK